MDKIVRELTRTVGFVAPPAANWLATNAWEQVVLPVITWRKVLLSLGNSGPWLHPNHVVMIHDAAHWDHPEWFTRAYLLKIRALNRRWARRAKVVLAPSAFTRDRLVHQLAIDENRIAVVGNGHRWSDAKPLRKPGSKPFALTVSTLSRRKNLETLLLAWPRIHEQTGMRLVVVGASGGRWAGEGTATETPSCVDLVGYVAERTLDDLYSECALFVSASLYEGFNIPALDAAVVGAPVVLSDIAVHRELFSEVAGLFHPTDVPSLLSAVDRALGGPAPSATAVDELASPFCWQSVSDRVLAATRLAGP